MTRKDEKETERPHYYSQFWLDVAAGRREIGQSKAEESADNDQLPESGASTRKTQPAAASMLVDGHRSARARDLDEEEFEANQPEEQEEFNEPEMEESELAGDLEDEAAAPDILFGDTGDTAEEDLLEEPQMEEEDFEGEDFYDEDEEDEDEDEWPARGRKKPKPGRQVKAPKPPKKPRRGGRGY
jgi:hypothetical protein